MISSRSSLRDKIFSVSKETFSNLALEVFSYQMQWNPVYANYVNSLKKNRATIDTIEQIPFLPIEFFKSFKILSAYTDAETVFTSSGTSGMDSSRHYVPDPDLYTSSFRKTFELFYGSTAEYCVLALLPSYLEREGSSLILMAADLIKKSAHPQSGFYLRHSEELKNVLLNLRNSGQKTLLLGVTFALLDFAEQFPLDFPELIVMETGGMKGRKKEMVRDEVHQVLKKGFGVRAIHSEYGMTELLSQAYSKGEGIFDSPPWMKVLIRDPNDPLSLTGNGKTGGINVIDLANLDSCAFIATQDLGKTHANGSFEVLGRFDHSDIRGCNLLVL